MVSTLQPDAREADTSSSSASSDVAMQQQRAQCETAAPELHLLPSVVDSSSSPPAPRVTTPRASSDSLSFTAPLLSASPPPLMASASAPSATFSSSSSDVPDSSPLSRLSSLSCSSSSASSSPAAAVSSLSVPSSPLVSPTSATRRPKLVDGLLHSSCHQCKTTKAQHLVLSCRSRPSPLRRSRQCRKKYCATCLLRTYGLDLTALTADELKAWVCPACVDSCCCAACKRSKEKSYSEHLNATHPAAVIGAGAVLQRGESGGAGLTSLLLPGGGEQLTSAVSSPSQSALVQQIQQLQQIQQMQQLHQTLQLLQTLANQNEASGAGGGVGAQQQQKPNVRSPFPLLSPVQAQQTSSMAASSPVSPTACQRSILQSPPQPQQEADDTTFGHQLDLRIALLRQQQQHDRDGAESSVRLPAQTPLKSVTSSGASSSRAASQVAPAASSSSPIAPSACGAESAAEGSDCDYAAIANKLMAAAALATRIFQEQQTGQEAQHYQQQCRLQQQHHTQHQQQQQQPQPQQQQQQTFVPALTESAPLMSSLSSPSHQLASTAAASVPVAPLSAAEAEWSQSLQQHGDVHRRQMLALQEHQRAQLQQLLQQQAIVRHHAVHNANHGGAVPLTPPPSSSDPQPLKRQALGVQSDSGSVHSLQQQVEALQVESLRLEQRRLQQEEDDIVMQQQQQQHASDTQRRQRHHHHHHPRHRQSQSLHLTRSPRSSLKSEPNAAVKMDSDAADVSSTSDAADRCERRMEDEYPLHFLTDNWQSGDAYLREPSSDGQQLHYQPMQQRSGDDDSDWRR